MCHGSSTSLTFFRRIAVPTFSGVCSFDEKDDFVQINIGDAFAKGQWQNLEPILQDLVDQLLKCRSRDVLLNLSALSFTRSAVVTAILRIWKGIIASGGRFVVLAPSDETRRILSVAGLNQHLSITENTGDALHALGVSRNARLLRRETKLLQWISPAAAAAAVISLLALMLSQSSTGFQRSILFVLVVSAVMASGGGWLTAGRHIGTFRTLSRLASATGIITLITAIGRW